MAHSRIPLVSLSATLVFLVAAGGLSLQAQQSATSDMIVPTFVQFSGVLSNSNGKPLTGITGVTFSLYAEQEGDAPLWMETQNVEPDASGHYVVMLGSTTRQGLPSNLFTSGEARWLGVQEQGQPERPRVMLLSVPYALKAGDAQTVGGLPASAFLLATPANGTAPVTEPSAGSSSAVPNIGGSGTTDFIPIWTDSTGDLGNSAMFQSGSGTTAKVGINTTTPASTLDVKGNATIRGPVSVLGTFSLPATGPATASKGTNSQPQDLAASAFNSSTSTAVNQTFQWQAEPVGNDTATPSGSLNLLFGQGTNKPSETGLSIAGNGLIAFATGQTFPGTGSGTITGVTAGSDLTGGGSSGTVTLNLDTTKVPQLNTSNTFTGKQTVNGNVSATGTVTGSSYQIGSNLFGFGSYANGNAYLGFAGNTVPTANWNTAVGYQALFSNATGQGNTANGYQALLSNTTGFFNTALGSGALSANTTGGSNVAIGADAINLNTTGGNNISIGGGLQINTIGSLNIGIGLDSLVLNTTGNNNTAIGPLTLGSTSGNYNTAVGYEALYSNPCSASNNTAIGYAAGYLSSGIAQCGQGNNNTFLGSNTQPTDYRFNNVTAIGANAQVGASNSIVLGSIQGVNGGTANTSVGIGTTTPQAPLDVVVPNAGTQNLLFFGANGVSGNVAKFTFAASAAPYPLTLTLDGRPLAIVGSSTGLVGIATTTPDNTLTVNGTADKPGGGSWGTFSDRRLKELKGNFRAGMDQIAKLNPVRYRYKQDNPLGIHDTEEHVGLIAQEVQAVIPEAVAENDKGYLLVNNDPIIWAMLNAIKEQQMLIQTQQRQIRTQQRQIKAQQTRGEIQHAQIIRLMSRVNAILASTRTNGRTSEVRTVKGKLPVMQQ